MQADLGSSEKLLPGLQMPTHALCRHVVEGREREKALQVSSCKSADPFMRTPPSWPNYPPKASPPYNITWWVKISTYGFGGGMNIPFFNLNSLFALLSFLLLVLSGGCCGEYYGESKWFLTSRSLQFRVYRNIKNTITRYKGKSQWRRVIEIKHYGGW